MATRYPGLTLIRNTWYVRIAVPESLRPLMGRREQLESLRTGDVVEARRVYPQVHRRLKAEIDRARLGISPVPELPAEEISKRLGWWRHVRMWEALAWVEGREGLEWDAITAPWKLQGEPDRSLTLNPDTANRAAYLKAFLDTAERDPLTDAWRGIPGFDSALHAALKGLEITLSADSPKLPGIRVEFAQHLLDTALANEHIRMTQAAKAHVQVLARTQPHDLVAAPITTDKPLPPPSLPLSQLFERWIATVKVQDKEIGRLRHQNQRLIEFFGDRPANHLRKVEIGEFLALVARFPGRKRSAALNDLPIRKLVEAFEAGNRQKIKAGQAPDPTLTKATAEEWFRSYSRMYEWAIAFELLERNPFKGLRIAIDGVESVQRRAFTDDEITAIFSKPLFQGAVSSYGYRVDPGEVQTRDAKFWLPILGLFHGARLSELAAMPVAGFRESRKEPGVWFFDLTDRKVKTDTSARLIPMHPAMKALGWLDYMEERRRAGDEFLFPELDHGSRHGPGHAFSKWWGTWLSRAGFSDPAITFHSFRHAWKRRARASEVKEEIHDVISGHKGMTVSRQYGEGADVEDLAREIAKIEFPAFPEISTPLTRAA